MCRFPTTSEEIQVACVKVKGTLPATSNSQSHSCRSGGGWPHQFYSTKINASSYSSKEYFGSIDSLFYRSQKWNRQYSCLMFQFHQHCHYSSCLLCSVIHYCSTSLCWGTLLYCEEEMWLPEVLLSDNSSQEAEATASTSVWWHCWTVSEHWIEGECRIWPCAAVNSTVDGIAIADSL